MSSITFVDYQTIIPASWLNDVNNMVYNGVVPATTLSPTNLSVSTNASIANITNNVVFTSTGAITLPNGTTAQEPGTPSAGMIRFNSTKTQFEGYNGSAWSSFGIVGGSNTQVQYNSSGALAGSANLIFDGTTLTANTLSVSTSTTTPIVQSSGSLLLKTNGTNTAVTIDTSQKVTFANSITFGSNQGIIFNPSTQGSGHTSNTLTDYEEGTWTPSVGGTATYYAQVGKYTRIGNIVRVSGSLVINSLGTGSATTISGLPFASTGSPADFIGFSNFSSLALTVVYIAGSANASSQIDIRSLLIAGTGIASNNVLGNGTRVDFAGTYSV